MRLAVEDCAVLDASRWTSTGVLAVQHGWRAVAFLNPMSYNPSAASSKSFRILLRTRHTHEAARASSITRVLLRGFVRSRFRPAPYSSNRRCSTPILELHAA